MTICFICFAFSSIAAWEGERGETTPALLTEYLKRPGLDCIFKSVTWERKLSFCQVMIETLASQSHGVAPSFVVVSSLPMRHFLAPPKPVVADRVRNLTKLFKCSSVVCWTPDYIPEDESCTPSFAVNFSVILSKILNISKYNFILLAKCWLGSWGI